MLETPLEIAHLSEIAIKVDYSRLPIFQIESRLAQAFQFDPLKMFSSVALVVTIPSDKVESAYRALHEMGIPFADISGVTEGTGVRIFKDEDIIHHDKIRAEENELDRVWALYPRDG